RDLPGEQQVRMGPKLQRWREQRGSVDIGVAMDLSEAQELRILQSRDHPQNACLFAELQMILESDQVEARCAQILLPQLNYGPWAPACPRIVEPHRFHGTEAQGIATATRQLFDRETCFEERSIRLVDVRRHVLRLQQLVDKGVVLLLVQRAVEIVVGAICRLAV